MQFKHWIETTDEKVFKRVTAKNSVLLAALGLPPDSKLHKINTGSFATIYQHPLDASLVIKATKDKKDVARLVKAQSLRSRNVVRLHPINGQLSIQLGQLHVVVADKIDGKSMPYVSNSFIMLMTGKYGNESAKKTALKIAQEGMSPFRDKILNHYGRNTDEERIKLSALFLTLARLELQGISLDDFTDNIIDAGDRYVIIDMGN